MKKNGLKNLAIAAAAIVTATTAQAVPVRWSFENVVSYGNYDEAWRGYLVFDQSIGKILEYDLGTAFAHFSKIRPINSSNPFSELNLEKQFKITWRDWGTTFYDLDIELSFGAPLTDLGGIVEVDGYEMLSEYTPFDGYSDYDVDFYTTYGFIEGTPEPDWVSPVPIPASGLLLLGAFGATAAASRKRRTPKA